MPHRLSLRTAVLAAVAAGAVLVPSAAAFADSAPSPSAPSVRKSAAAARADGGATAVPKERAQPSVAPRGGVAAGDSPAPAPAKTAATVKRPGAAAPRGGVAAGERPVGTAGDRTTAVAGSAAAALLVAGAGTIVLRRRSAAQRNG
ncbi:hypothetical protein OG978_35240 [Streptomyces sp. NBC_01591]|uniref:hypothetical protein n=1 Tax=Streptomyces sp. NBC_01591 TaxID=2975888 RepID=UPI002DD8B761|nr:hypothetical protein [Streptomyces sp. NBC_01591]WSD72191.1 hypothetical protein OG978_35240 [Streptomyces sp. NBC_01591]